MKTVGIYRTTFPAVSEVFITEQINNFRHCRAVVIVRDVVENNVMLCGGRTPYRLASNCNIRKKIFTIFRRMDLGKMVEAIGTLDLIHAHFGPDGVMILPTARKLGVPLVVTFHGFDAQMSRRALLRTRMPTNWQFLLHERQLQREGALFIAVSNFIRGKLIAKGYPPEKVVVQHIGIDTGKFAPGDESLREKVILNVSRHVACKGLDTLLRGFARVCRDFPEWRLVQIGAGGETGALKQLAASLGIEDQVVWLGAQPHEQVRDWMRRASIYAQASQQDEAGQTEAFGIVLLEAAASGLPVIATRSGGMPEAVVEGETGFMFPERGDSELSNLLLTLMDQPERRLQMGRAGRQYALRFDIRLKTQELEALYEKVLG